MCNEKEIMEELYMFLIAEGVLFEFLELIPHGKDLKAHVKNIKSTNDDDYTKTKKLWARYLIRGAIFWTKTKQGHNFWARIDKKWLKNVKSMSEDKYGIVVHNPMGRGRRIDPNKSIKIEIDGTIYRIRIDRKYDALSISKIGPGMVRGLADRVVIHPVGANEFLIK